MPAQIPPETADGWVVLHQMFRLRWADLHELDATGRQQIAADTREYLEHVEPSNTSGQTAAFHLLGHKGDLLLIHFRQDVDQCVQAELDWSRRAISPLCEPTASYLSIVELGLYYDTIAVRDELTARGLTPDSPEWSAELQRQIDTRRERLHGRRFLDMPPHKYVSFYPMNKRRGETCNWYNLDIQDRGRLMMGHGEIGRKYAGRVQQIISGSIGLDDWEWGVDLFADDPAPIKRLVYEMRFDEGSSIYGEFGPFYFARRIFAKDIEHYLAGKLPVEGPKGGEKEASGQYGQWQTKSDVSRE